MVVVVDVVMVFIVVVNVVVVVMVGIVVLHHALLPRIVSELVGFLRGCDRCDIC